MTSEQFEQLVSLSKLVVAAASGTTVSVFGVIKFFDFQKTRVQEQSVGATAVGNMQDCIDTLSHKFDIFEEKFRAQEKKIDRLQASDDDLMRTLVNWIKR